MTPENFCYWLQGFFEIRDGGFTNNMTPLTAKQVIEIRNHLALVFKKETPQVGKLLCDIRDMDGNPINIDFENMFGPYASC